MQISCIRSIVYVLALSVIGTIAAPVHGKTVNITVTLPVGSTLYDSKVICTPADWKDIVVFFLVNYIAHALTTVVLPGEGWESYLTNALASLMFPGFGAYRGLRAIFVGWAAVRKKFRAENYEHGESESTHKHKARRARDLQMARRAGALCMIVRAPDWTPRNGDEIDKNALLVQGAATTLILKENGRKEALVTEQDLGTTSIDDDEALLGSSDIELASISTGLVGSGHLRLHTYPTPWTYCRKACLDSVGSRTIRCAPPPSDLAPGYTIIMLPACTPVRNLPNDAAIDRINSSYDVMRGLVALVQALLAIQTLYQTRGNQIQRYGFAAFGLTVAPYAVMSIVNLLGSLARPDYDAVYMVGSSVMLEERRRKGLDGYYDGVVGEVFEADTDSNEEFADNPVEEGTQSVKGSIRFITVEDRLCVQLPDRAYVPSSYTGSENHIFRVIAGMRPDPREPHPSLFIPNASSFSYNRRAKGLVREALPSLHITDKLKWPRKLRPRSTGYIKRSRYLAFAISLSPLIPILALSGFQTGSSTTIQQAFTMLWLAWGSAIGFLVAKYEKQDTIGEKVDGVTKLSSVMVKVVFFVVLGWPAIAGWVVVARMLLEYGKCSKLPG
jgi:hypothetical protein